MRNFSFLVAGATLVFMSLSAPASADKVTFSPKAFQVFGGIDDGSAKAVSYRLSDIPEEMRSRTITFQSQLPAGSIIVKTGSRRLYYILPNGQAIEYRIGVGREGFTWSGENTVSRKAEWPDWRPPQEMIRREAKKGRKLPAFMPGGPRNPLGARALYIGHTEYRIQARRNRGASERPCRRAASA